MNPLTQIKNTQKISKQEILQGVPESASWHARYKHSAYVYAGGLPFDLTEGDVLTVFAQYGELVDVHNVKDRDTGKYRGFSFLAYEDQRSTVLAVDNLNGATVGGRTVRVEHVDNYKKKKAEVGSFASECVFKRSIVNVAQCLKRWKAKKSLKAKRRMRKLQYKTLQKLQQLRQQSLKPMHLEHQEVFVSAILLRPRGIRSQCKLVKFSKCRTKQ